jgi:hypothetical protein
MQGADPPSEPTPDAADAKIRRASGRIARRARRFGAEDASGVEARHLAPIGWRLLFALVPVVILLIFGVRAPWLPAPTPRPLDTRTERANAAVDRLVAGDPDALRAVVGASTSAYPALIRAVCGTHPLDARRRAAAALRTIALVDGGALSKADAAPLDQVVRDEPDAAIRDDCAAARGKLSVFWR